MAFKWTSEWLWAAAIVVRSLPAIAFPTIPELLARRVEVSTPVNSFKRCEIGVRKLARALLIVVQYKKASFSTKGASHRMMEASFIRYASSPRA